MKNFHEIELLSSYLDGQLNAKESKRLETRLAADPELASVLNDIRATRSILRKLPTRKAPRNFTLTRKMVGLKPPLPRTYPLFRFSTAFATILLMLTFVANSFVPRIAFGGAAAPAPAMGYGGGPGSGGGCDTCAEEPALQSEAATEAPAAIEAPAAEAPSAEMLPAATLEGTLRETEPAADTLQAPKEGEAESALQNQAPVKNEALIPIMWQIVLLGIILLSGLGMWLIQKSASRKWR